MSLAAGAGEGPAVGGLTPLSTADWPDMLAAVVFCQGCAWACPYCHNPSLRTFGPGERTWRETLDWLATRRGLLDAVVFSGGEPLLQPGLAAAMRQVRDLGFRVGLHTSGMDPAALTRALPLTDWAGLDLKAPRAAYARISGRPDAAAAAWRSLELLRESGVAFELRTTWHPALLTADDLLALAAEIAAVRPATWALQAFQPAGCADAGLAGSGRQHVPEALAARLREALGPETALLLRG